MVKQNLAQLTQQVRDKYVDLLSIVVPAEQVSLRENGFFFTGKNEFPVTREASVQFARLLKIPPNFYLTLESDLRAVFFSRGFAAKLDEAGIGPDLRITLNGEKQIIGYDDPNLLKISPIRLVETMNISLPGSLSVEQIEVSRLSFFSNIISFSCYSTQIKIEPRVGDIINGGVDVHHSTTGEFGTQVRIYLRRKICENGACTHICQDNKQLRARRLSNGKFDEQDMTDQIRSLFLEAWTQLDTKLQAVRDLINKPRISPDFLKHERARFSLNNRILTSIQKAIDQDEIGPTGTQYDYFNAVSRVATHDDSLSLRQRRRLMFMADELSQQDTHKCPRCGSWVFERNKNERNRSQYLT